MKTASRRLLFVFSLVGLMLGFINPKPIQATMVQQQSEQILITNERFVFEPNYISKDVQQFLEQHPGVLKNYAVQVGDLHTSAAEAIFSLSLDQSSYVNVKVLLTLLELRSQLITNPNPSEDVLIHPFGASKDTGFVEQIKWLAELLRQNFHDYSPTKSQQITLHDGTKVEIQAPNAGTFAVKVALASISNDLADYQRFTGTGIGSFLHIYTELFEDPTLLNRPNAPLATNPFLFKPFSATPSVSAFFDHNGSGASTVRFDGATGHPYNLHTGTDYAMSIGTPIFAAANGTIIDIKINYTEGNPANWCPAPYTPVTAITLRHVQNGMTYDTLYWHLNNGAIADNPNTGQQFQINDVVDQGVVIGYSGNTGCSTGAHLHFGVVRNGAGDVDPYGWCGSGTDPWGITNDMLWAGAISNPAPCPVSFSSPYGYIDGPPHNSIQNGTVTVGGWAKVNGGTIARVEIWINGYKYINAVYGDSRPDVGGNFGWHWTWNTLTFGNATYTIKVKAVATNGTETWLGAPPEGTTSSFNVIVSNPVNTCLKALYRYVNPAVLRHFYTQNWAAIGVGNSTWQHEGVMGYVMNSSNCFAPNGIALYRLWSDARQKHIYTTSTFERDTLIGQGFTLEGTEGYVLASANSTYGTVGVYRLYHNGRDDHFYTTSQTEVNAAVAAGYTNEGIAFYVFNLVNQAPNKPNLTAPVNNAVTANPAVTLTWTDGGDPDNYPRNYRDYQVKIRKSDNTWSQTRTWNTATSWSITVPSKGKYCWTVAAGDGWTDSGWQTERCFSYNQAPNKPTLTTPANNAVFATTTVNLTWTDGGDPDNYPRTYRDYQAKVYLVGGTWTQTRAWGTTTSWTITVPSSGKYCWAVNAGDGLSMSGYTTERCFFVNQAPNKPNLTAPANNSATASLTANLQWTDAGDPDNYPTVVHTAQAKIRHTDGSWTNTQPWGSAMTWSVTLPKTGKYCWTAQVSDSLTVSGWQTERCFTVYPQVQIGVNAPANNATVTQGLPYRVYGYSIQREVPSGTGVDRVHLYLDGTSSGFFLGYATYGLDRTDVANTYGQQFLKSGFSYTWDTKNLSIGQHTLYIYAYSPLTGWTSTTRTINVVPAKKAFVPMAVK